jgi:hypothetical protein
LSEFSLKKKIQIFFQHFLSACVSRIGYTRTRYLGLMS